ncbi:MAG: DUF4170 domain-containing protein [Pseudomonadota bacterium]
MDEFWVFGGEYSGLDFRTPAAGRALERYGPFPTCEAARREGQARTMASIDFACVRYRIGRGEGRRAAGGQALYSVTAGRPAGRP